MTKAIDLITTNLTKSHQKKLDRASNTLELLSGYVDRRQIVTPHDVNKYDIDNINKLLAMEFDYKKVVDSKDFVIEDKNIAKRISKGFKLLAKSIRTKKGIGEADSLDVRYLYDHYLFYFLSSTISLTEIRKLENTVFYEGLDSANVHNTRYGGYRRYFFPYQYTEMNKRDEKKLEKALKERKKKLKKIRVEAGKKAYQTRLENEKRERLALERAERKRIEREAWEDKKLDLTRGSVEKIKSDINAYIEKGHNKHLFIDTETDSLENPRLIEIAIVDIDREVIVNTLIDSFDVFLPENGNPVKNPVNKIKKSDLENAPLLKFFEDELAMLFKDRDLCFYNADFDTTAIMNSVSEDFDFKPCSITDVMEDFAVEYGEWVDWAYSYRWQTLATACDYYDIKPGDHRALSDAIATLEVYLAMYDV